MRSRP